MQDKNDLSPKAIQEYNKLFTLPIKALLYARVLSAEKKGRGYIFAIRNYEMLDYIASRDSNAAKFLALYFRKVLGDSGIYSFLKYCYETKPKIRYRMHESYMQSLIKNTRLKDKKEEVI